MTLKRLLPVFLLPVAVALQLRCGEDTPFECQAVCEGTAGEVGRNTFKIGANSEGDAVSDCEADVAASPSRAGCAQGETFTRCSCLAG